MNRRTFLRTTGLLGAAGAAGCAMPFSPPDEPSGGNRNGNGDGSNSKSGAAAGTSTPTATRTPEPTPTPEPPETRSGAALTGVYAGGDGLASNLTAYTNWLSQKPAVAMVFVDALVPRAAKKGFVEGALTDVWEAGHVPLVSWQPFKDQHQRTSEIVERQIARGKYDNQLRTWANLLADWARPRDGATRGRRFYFRPAHEMNGTWFPWSAVDSTRIGATPEPAGNRGGRGNPAAGTPRDYVGMWRQIHRIFSKTGMDETDIQWIWSPNADERGGVRTERYYPGDDYVDWIGLDGFNFGGSQEYENGYSSNWRSPRGVFDSMLRRVRKLTDKPVALTEFASSSVPESGNGYQPRKKAGWIEDVFGYVEDNDIKMTCWFNVDQTGDDESDWAVFGGKRGTSQVTVGGKQYPVYDAYKQTVSGSKYLAALPDYPPLLTDDEFAGKF